MNALFFVLVASLVAVSTQQSLQETLNEWRKLLSPHTSRCMCQSGANSGQVEAFFQFGELSNNPCFKCNLRCWAEGVNLLTSTGRFNTTVFGSIFGITDEIVHKCGTITHVDLCEQLYEITRCSMTMAQAANSKMVLPVAPVPAVSKVKVWDPVTQYFMGNNGYIKTKFV